MTHAMSSLPRVQSWLSASLGALAGFVWGQRYRLLGVALGLAGWAVLARWLVTLTWMSSGSMAPALISREEARWSDWVVVERFTQRHRQPKRGELVYFKMDDGEWVIKRVVGLPGERLELRRGVLRADGRIVDLPGQVQGRYFNGGSLAKGSSTRVPGGRYFVLGDDSADSYDSRYWGALDAGDIRGYARAVAWPPWRIGWR